MKRLTVLCLVGLLLASAAVPTAQVNAAFLVEAHSSGKANASNFAIIPGAGNATGATASIPSDAVGTTLTNSIFGSDNTVSGVVDTYQFSYTPGTDADNTVFAAGTVLGSKSGFPGNGNRATGLTGGLTGLYNVYFTTPASSNVNAAGSNFTMTQDGAPIVLPYVNLNSTGTGPDTTPGAGFVGGANNAWELLGTVHLTAGSRYTVTQTSNADSFVSQRAHGVMWEPVPEYSVLDAGYTFTNIMDSSVPTPTGNYMNIGDAAISGNRVAFKAREEGFVSHDSIFTSTGGPRTQVVQTPSFAPSDDTSYGRPPEGGRFHALGRPVIDGRQVYFEAQVFYPDFRYGDGIFYGDSALPVVATAVSPHAGPQFAINRTIADPLKSNGYLAYRKSSGANSALDTIQVLNPEKTSTTMIVGVGSPAPLGGTFSFIDANYDLSGPTVAFRGVVGSQDGIYTGAGGPLTTIVKQGDSTPLGGAFDSVLDPTISGSTVAFLGTYAGGNGIFASDGGALSTIVRSGDTTPGGKAFTGFSVPTIAFNTVAFRGDYAGGGGIYAKYGDALSKVVEIGDPLFGSTVASLTFSDLGFDPGGSGNLAFTYGLADGRSGVAMATHGAGPPTIFQDPAGKIPVPDSVGINWVPVADFSGRNLTKAWLVGADLESANGHNVNLTSAVLRGADLTNADLSGANLSGTVLDTARLNGANLSGAQVRGARFEREFLAVVNSCFVDCFAPIAVGYGGITPPQLSATASYQAHDLAGIRLAGNDLSNLNLAGQNLTGANFTLATLTGAVLTGADIRKASFSRYPISATLEDCHYGDCTAFTGIIGSGITLDQLYSTKSYLAHDLYGINFGGNNLAGGNFAGHNLANTNFNAATLTDADFTGAEVRGANFGIDISTPLNGSGITLAQLSSTASYQAHDLSGIRLDNNDLTRGNFVGQNLTNASFRGAALTEADLSGAEVRGAIFSGDARRYAYGDVYSGVVVRGLIFYGTGIMPAQLYSTASYQAHDLSGSSFDYNDFTGANLAGQNLSNARFYGATLTGANLSQANLTSAAFGANDFTRVNPIGANPTSLDLIPAWLSGANLSGANLTNANFAGLQLCDGGCDDFPGADLTGANLSLADARGANFFLAILDGANTANLIQSGGHIAGVDLTADTSLVVRDYDGNPPGGVAPPTGPLPISVDQHFMTGPGGTLRMLFDADAWDSTISFAAGIPVTRGGTLELLFANGIRADSHIGRTFQLFDWTGVNPTGAFSVSSPYTWDLSKLYTTGEVTLTAVPEPSSLPLAALGVLGLVACARRPRGARNVRRVEVGKTVKSDFRPAMADPGGGNLLTFTFVRP